MWIGVASPCRPSFAKYFFMQKSSAVLNLQQENHSKQRTNLHRGCVDNQSHRLTHDHRPRYRGRHLNAVFISTGRTELDCDFSVDYSSRGYLNNSHNTDRSCYYFRPM